MLNIVMWMMVMGHQSLIAPDILEQQISFLVLVSNRVFWSTVTT